MRFFLVASVVALSCLGNSAYAEPTCDAVAARCVAMGGSASDCSGARLRSCHATGVYITPRGKHIPAKK